MTLRLRLTLLNGLVLLLALAAFAAVTYVTQEQVLQRNLDASLQDQFRLINDAALPFLERGRLGTVTFPNPNRFGPEVYIQITGRDGSVAGRSANLEDATLPSGPDDLRRALGGERWISTVDVEGQPLRLLTGPLQVQRPPGRGQGPGGAPRPGEPFTAGMIQVARPLAPVEANLRSLQTTLLTVGGVAVALSLVIAWLLARAALLPIDWLAATAHAIGAARDFRRRVPSPPAGRRDEVGRLAEEFNQMLGELQAAYQQLEAALEAQRRFVADASHELRTPLTSLRGNVELLRQMVALAPPAEAEEEQEQLLADMAAETERLTRLVADLLWLARADAGQHLSLAPLDAAAVVRDAFRAARFLREDVLLHLGEVPDGLWVTGDADRLKQLLLILLDNALKYSPAGGTVTMRAAPGVSIAVADTGPGIPREEQSRIFDRFHQVDSARAAGGAGLGLAIARWIVEEHGGRIDVQSAPGAGSTFTVHLPAIEVPQTTPVAATAGGR